MPEKVLNVLVTGGAGYIGSHAVWALKDAGHKVIVIDDLSTGRRENLPVDVPLFEGTIGDKAFVLDLLQAHSIDSVMHFAGSIIVPESVEQPIKYFSNNTVNSLALIDACVDAGVARFIFSSTAAVYGEPSQVPIPESHPLAPLNPYGDSKLMTETCLRRVSDICDMKHGILRYFNVAGADPDLRTGQAGPNATHLIKVACQVASGARDRMSVFGTDYATDDGTAIRDYIHVSDLIQAHLAALAYLSGGGDSFTGNCGYGHGYSVLEVIAAVERVLGKKLAYDFAPRRPGDSPVLVADTMRIHSLLDWEPAFDNLELIVQHALAWERHLNSVG